MLAARKRAEVVGSRTYQEGARPSSAGRGIDADSAPPAEGSRQQYDGAGRVTVCLATWETEELPIDVLIEDPEADKDERGADPEQDKVAGKPKVKDQVRPVRGADIEARGPEGRRVL